MTCLIHNKVSRVLPLPSLENRIRNLSPQARKSYRADGLAGSQRKRKDTGATGSCAGSKR